MVSHIELLKEILRNNKFAGYQPISLSLLKMINDKFIKGLSTLNTLFVGFNFSDTLIGLLSLKKRFQQNLTVIEQLNK